MQHIARQALVLHPAEKMYGLVNDVADYHRFLRWCSHGEVINASTTAMTASLTIRVAGVEQRFTTQNLLEPDRSIRMQLVDGPFRQLVGHWLFQPLGDAGCRVSLALDFEFSSGILSSAFRSGFAGIANQMVDQFVARADEVFA